MGNHRYTPEEIRFLKRNVKGRSVVDLTDLFNRQFGLQLSAGRIRGIKSLHKLRNGRGPRPTKPIGSRRTQTNGSHNYLVVKTANPGKWEKLHRVIWEKANGKVPKGHIVIFANGNNRDFALDNLLLVSRRELAVMNRRGLISPHRELTITGKAVAALKIAINKRKRKAKKTRRNA